MYTPINKCYRVSMWVVPCAVLIACGGASDTGTPDQVVEGSPLPESLSLPAPPGALPEGDSGGSADQETESAPDAESQPISDDAESPEELSELDGTWRTGCIEAPSAQAGPGRFILSAGFGGSRSETSSARFNDENCSHVFMETVTVGRWTKRATVLIPSGFQALQLDTRVESIAMTFHDPQTVTSLNRSGYCGSILEVGVSVDLTQCFIDMGIFERDRFGLVMVVDGVLYPGDASTGNGSSPESRPTDVDFTQAHFFIQP